jgi:prepilin-type N-terminal cleavage/methylation domain-containing protein
MKFSNRLRQAAFSLAEVMVAVGVFGILASSSIVALNQMNNRAFISRCQTGASTVAQNQIDLVLSNMPFNPTKNQVPPELVIGTTTVGSSSNPTVPVYTDPRVGGIVVRGWMTTVVTDTGATLSGVALSVYRVRVTVNYRFRGKNYAVTMNTMRCSDI